MTLLDASSPTHALAQWVVDAKWSDVDAATRASVASSWLNWFACALGGAGDPALHKLILALAPWGRGDAPLIGRAETFDPANQALLHAFASNILDYDDTHWPTGIHPAGTVASALLAWASQTVVSGQDVLHAFLLGMEVSCRIGQAVSPGHYERGWHITASCGVFGAAMAVGRLMRLNPTQMAWAMGHAATQSSGLVASLGTMAKSLNIAHAARNGLLAAQFARHGITANDRVLEARFGFNELMGSRPLDAGLCARLGHDWLAAQNTFKPYPCGFLLHPTLDACLAEADAPLPAGDAMDHIGVTVHPLSRLRADRPQPADGLASKLSLQHAVAVALTWGQAGVRAFTDDAVHDPAVHACRQKVKVVADEGLGTEDARVTIHLQSGRVISREAHGTPGPMGPEALTRKFRDLVAFGAPHGHADGLLQALAGFADMDNAADLIAMTTPPA
jgi:2-methylcitrate dehydratase PrpD